jgi:hypothetical protein
MEGGASLHAGVLSGLPAEVTYLQLVNDVSWQGWHT